jgi:hydroxymethylglutaryl-CoA lyase
MADHAEVMAALPKGGVVYSALVPNAQGAEAALAAGAQALAVFTAASESFSRKNTNCSIEEGIARFEPVARLAKAAGVPLRGYISCCLDCPFEGEIAPSAVADVGRRLADVGCDEIAVSDTLGRGTPARTKRAFEAVLAHLPAARLAGHFHDTFGHAIENVQAAYDVGVRVFDGAVGGLGGCPYAPGAAGNLATERLVAHFLERGMNLGIDMGALQTAGAFAKSLRRM